MLFEWNSFLTKFVFLWLAEYDAVARLGIPDVKNFIKKRLKGESIVYLNTCCVGTGIRERLDAEIDEALATVGWIDVTVGLRF